MQTRLLNSAPTEAHEPAMTPSPEFVRLHLAILVDPDDDTARYSLADGYDRTGQATRADSLRTAVRDREVLRGPLPGKLEGRAVFRRGLVAEAVEWVDEFLDRSEELFDWHPFTRVECFRQGPGPGRFRH